MLQNYEFNYSSSTEAIQATSQTTDTQIMDASRNTVAMDIYVVLISCPGADKWPQLMIYLDVIFI